ncbi:succinyldiaminopimelate transaminase [Lysobacter korlensis]|uniref:Aminotransferase n=1 Tax=Lysobacter korlensis TaxID=553636 RepID=A0ABV6S097_9GAMM
MTQRDLGLSLPGFPWDSLAPHAATARRHPSGLVDLSVGSPVDTTPELVRAAIRDASDAHAYPLTAGSTALRDAIAAWYARRRGVTGLGREHVLPSIGSKELIAWTPLMLGLGPGDVVVQPSLAYPTYAIAAALARAESVAEDDPDAWPDNARLIWLNSPGNPDGRVLDAGLLAAAVSRARELGAVIANDECYAELNWAGDEPTACILAPEVTGGDLTGVLSVYSLSKQSNLAGYRAGFAAGDPAIVAALLAVRKHAGLLPPAPVQAAMAVALGDDEHVAAQRVVYRSRRERLAAALTRAGFRIDESTAGLYLWATRGQEAWATVAALAELGILVAPGTFYGDAGAGHVRVALTASDAAIDEAVERLAHLGL